MDLQIELTSASTRNRYSYYLACYLSSGESVEVVGISHLNYSVTVLGNLISFRVLDYDPPIAQYTRSSGTVLQKTNNIAWSGSIDVKFNSMGIVQNETIEFILGITMVVSAQDYSNLDLISYVVFFSWIFAFLVIPLILKFIIQPLFGISSDAETRKKQKNYFDYLEKKSQEEET